MRTGKLFDVWEKNKQTHYYNGVVNCVHVSEREISNLPFSFCSTLAGIS